MDAGTWKTIWHVVLIVSSLMFYGIVVVVGVKGMGDVKEMIAAMIAEKRSNPDS